MFLDLRIKDMLNFVEEEKELTQEENVLLTLYVKELKKSKGNSFGQLTEPSGKIKSLLIDYRLYKNKG